MFTWMIFSGTSALYRSNDHLVMDFFSGKFSPKMNIMVNWVITIASLVFFVVLLVFGIQVVGVRMTIPYESWKLPTGYAYLAVPVNAVIMILFTIERILFVPEGCRFRRNNNDK
jgi:TRAP-type C4-dicarboxylate transport system permease small subunit